MKQWTILLWALPSLVLAQQAPLKVEEMVRALTPPPMTRSLGGTTRNLQPTLDLTIQFDLDSAKLKPDSMPLLSSLVEAMKNDRLAAIKFKVEGHTDAQGSEQHNLKLSQSRAESVMAYLTSQGVNKERLTGEGKGFSDLLLPEKPKAAENRRVRITTQP